MAPIVAGLITGIVLAFVDVRAHLDWIAAHFRGTVDRVADANIAVFVIILMTTLFLTIAIHEAGHAIVGRLVGFRIHSIRIWRLQLEFPPRLSIFRGPMGGAGGWAICTPESTDNLAVRAGLMLFAGPAVNLLTALLLYAMFPASGLFLLVFMIWSFAIGAVNLLPLRTGPLFSDGHRILTLLFDRARGERWLALIALSKDLLDGAPPESFSDDIIKVATAIEDDSSDTVSAHVLAYMKAFRNQQCDEAALALETCLRCSSRTSKPLQHALMADAAVFHGRCRKNAAIAEAWLNDMPAKLAIPWHRQWAEAGVLHARGERAALMAKLDAIERAIREHPGPHQKVAVNAVEFWRKEIESSWPA